MIDHQKASKDNKYETNQPDTELVSHGGWLIHPEIVHCGHLGNCKYDALQNMDNVLTKVDQKLRIVQLLSLQHGADLSKHRHIFFLGKGGVLGKHRNRLKSAMPILVQEPMLVEQQ